MRDFTILSVLASQGHDVSVVSFAEPHEMQRPLDELRSFCRTVELVPMPGGGARYLGRLRGLISAQPYGALRYRSSLMSAAIERLHRDEKFDVIILDDVYSIGNLPESVHASTLLDKQDLTFEVIDRYLQYERNPLKRIYGRLESRKVRRLEVTASAACTRVTPCSERDGDLIRRISPNARVSVVPNVIQIDSYKPTLTDDGATVLYVGAMDWFPNRDAVEFFATSILPHLRKLVPNVQFVAAGRNVPDAFRAQFAGVPNMRFTGEVPDMTAEIARAAVCVVPLRIGSGTRIKILEAAAMGKAVVSTSIGAEGLDLADGKEILIADEPEAFARSVAALVEAPSARQAMGVAARKFVEQHHSFAALGRALSRVLGELDVVAEAGARSSAAKQVETA
jgi:glycosyltransferase involved in cell wall biosynthesis